MRNSRWLRLLAYATGSVNQEPLLRNEYLAAENRTKLPPRLRLFNSERITLAEIGKRLGRKALREVACIAKPTFDAAVPYQLALQETEPTLPAPRRGSPRRARRSKSLLSSTLANASKSVHNTGI